LKYTAAGGYEKIPYKKTDVTSENKRQSGAKSPAAAEFTEDLAHQDKSPDIPLAAAEGESIEDQAALLNDTRFQAAQRQALAAQIGQVQGNQHLQRVIEVTSNTDSVVARTPDWPQSQRGRYDRARTILENDYNYAFSPGPEDDIAPTYWTVIPSDAAPFEVERADIAERLEALIERHQGGHTEGEGTGLRLPSWLLPEAQEQAELVSEDPSLVSIGIDVSFFGSPITIRTGSGVITTQEQGLQTIRTSSGVSIHAFRFYPTNRDDPALSGVSEDVFNSYQEWNAQFYDYLLDIPVPQIQGRMHQIEQATLEQMMYMVIVSSA
jgi:hypothetical protein